MAENRSEEEIQRRLRTAADTLDQSERANGGARTWEQRFRLGNAVEEVSFFLFGHISQEI